VNEIKNSLEKLVLVRSGNIFGKTRPVQQDKISYVSWIEVF